MQHNGNVWEVSLEYGVQLLEFWSSVLKKIDREAHVVQIEKYSLEDCLQNLQALVNNHSNNHSIPRKMIRLPHRYTPGKYLTLHPHSAPRFGHQKSLLPQIIGTEMPSAQCPGSDSQDDKLR